MGIAGLSGMVTDSLACRWDVTGSGDIASTVSVAQMTQALGGASPDAAINPRAPAPVMGSITSAGKSVWSVRPGTRGALPGSGLYWSGPAD